MPGDNATINKELRFAVREGGWAVGAGVIGEILE